MNVSKKRFTKDSLKNFLAKNEKRLIFDSWASVEIKFLYTNKSILLDGLKNSEMGKRFYNSFINDFKNFNYARL